MDENSGDIKQPDARPIQSIFDDRLCELIEEFSGDGMMCAGDIVSVIEFVKHRLIHKADSIAEELDMS